MIRILLAIFLISSVAVTAEEIETRKTVKKSAAVEFKKDFDARANDVEVETTTVKESSVSQLLEVTTETLAESTTVAEAPLNLLELSPSTSASPVVVTVEEIEITSAATENFSSSTENSLSLIENSSESSEDSSELKPDSKPDSIDNNIPSLVQIPKRKVLYINQQQSGKLNVHLELNDVSVIVIPNQKDPQLSLLNLLFKSAQKSKMQNEAKKKEGNVNSLGHHHDEYSQYKHAVRTPDENFVISSPSIPLIESRAPYKVEISSTLAGQQSQPAVDIVPNAHQQSNPAAAGVQQFQPQFARSPIMQLLKPIPFTIQAAPGQVPHNGRIFKRSIDSRLLGIDSEIPTDSENSVNFTEDELTESFFNSLDNDEEFNIVDGHDGSEFVLLGATENCGPGRKRNSYQICVAVDADDMK